MKVGSTNSICVVKYSMLRITPVRLETSGGVLSTVEMVVQRHDSPRWLCDDDDDDDDDDAANN